MVTLCYAWIVWWAQYSSGLAIVACFLIEFEHEAAVRGVAYGIYIYTCKMIYVGLSSEFCNSS